MGPEAVVSPEEVVVGVLRRVPYFAPASTGVLSELAASSRVRNYAPNDFVFRQGDRALGFFVVISGRVKVTRGSETGEETVLHLMEAGDFIGEVPLHAEALFPATASAISESRLLYVPREALFFAIRQDPEIAFRLLGSLAKRLLTLVMRFEGITRQSVSARLARLVLETAARDGRVLGEVTEVPLALSRTEMARVVGTTRETVSRIFSSWSRSGWITLERKRLVLLDRTSLERAVS